MGGGLHLLKSKWSYLQTFHRTMGAGFNESSRPFHYGRNQQQLTIHITVAYTSQGSQSYAALWPLQENSLGVHQSLSWRCILKTCRRHWNTVCHRQQTSNTIQQQNQLLSDEHSSIHNEYQTCYLELLWKVTQWGSTRWRLGCSQARHSTCRFAIIGNLTESLWRSVLQNTDKCGIDWRVRHWNCQNNVNPICSTSHRNHQHTPSVVIISRTDLVLRSELCLYISQVCSCHKQAKQNRILEMLHRLKTILLLSTKLNWLTPLREKKVQKHNITTWVIPLQ